MKAGPVIAAAGARLIEDRAEPGARAGAGGRRPTGRTRPRRVRDDPGARRRAGGPRAHLARLERSVERSSAPRCQRISRRGSSGAAAAAPAPLQRMPGRDRVAAAPVRIRGQKPSRSRPSPRRTRSCSPRRSLPGGLGAHKWRDRRLLDELAERLEAVPLLVDLDGDVLEAGYANLFIVEGTHLVTPPLDGRQLPGTVRARVLALHPTREERLTLDRIAAPTSCCSPRRSAASTRRGSWTARSRASARCPPGGARR